MSESQAHRFITTTPVSKNMVKQNLLANVYLMPSDTIQCQINNVHHQIFELVFVPNINMKTVRKIYRRISALEFSFGNVADQERVTIKRHLH